MARTRLPYCSPYRLFTSLRPGSKSWADRIHRAYAIFVWRSVGARHVVLIALLSVIWPAVFVVTTALFTRTIGPTVAARTGQGLARQLWEQMWLATVHSIPPDKYYVFELFRDERRALARDYIMRHELKGAFHNLMRQRAMVEPRDPRARLSLANKLLFARTCHAAGIDVPETLAYLDVGKSGAHGDWCLKGIENRAFPSAASSSSRPRARAGEGARSGNTPARDTWRPMGGACRRRSC